MSQTIIEVEADYRGQIVYPFQSMHPQYGHAEFTICVQWKRGKVSDLWIEPRQQDDEKMYHFSNGVADSFMVDNSYHQSSEGFKIWYFQYCKVHKCQVMSVYVPTESNCWYLSAGGTIQMIFKRQ